MAEPAVAVLVAAWQAEANLARAVESALAQTVTDYELVISDDEDDSAQQRIPRYRVSQPRKAAAATSYTEVVRNNVYYYHPRQVLVPSKVREEEDDQWLDSRFLPFTSGSAPLSGIAFALLASSSLLLISLC